MPKIKWKRDHDTATHFYPEGAVSMVPAEQAKAYCDSGVAELVDESGMTVRTGQAPESKEYKKAAEGKRRTKQTDDRADTTI